MTVVSLASHSTAASTVKPVIPTVTVLAPELVLISATSYVILVLGWLEITLANLVIRIVRDRAMLLDQENVMKFVNLVTCSTVQHIRACHSNATPTAQILVAVSIME